MATPFLRSAFLLINILYVFNCKSQPTYSETAARMARMDSSVHLNDYDAVFIVHFNFCSGSELCGDQLVRYILRMKKKNILIICDTSNVYCRKLLENSIRVKFVEFATLERYGLFSFYNLCIQPKRKKIKRLR